MGDLTAVSLDTIEGGHKLKRHLVAQDKSDDVRARRKDNVRTVKPGVILSFPRQ